MFRNKCLLTKFSKENEITQNTDAPTLDENNKVISISRDEAIKQTERIEFENENIKGSISLKGAVIDDLIFKNYKTSLNSNEKVIYLGPRNIESGYLVESGFVTSDKNIDIPDSESVWTAVGNNRLTENSSIKLSWTNDQGLTFQKEFLDDKYLFNINQKVINESEKKYDFYSYGQIIRNEIPEITDFFILHEGLLATLDGDLIEKDYDDIQEEKFSKTAKKGFIAIVDKYFVTSLIPPKIKNLKQPLIIKINLGQIL